MWQMAVVCHAVISNVLQQHLSTFYLQLALITWLT